MCKVLFLAFAFLTLSAPISAAESDGFAVGVPVGYTFAWGDDAEKKREDAFDIELRRELCDIFQNIPQCNVFNPDSDGGGTDVPCEIDPHQAICGAE